MRIIENLKRHQRKRRKHSPKSRCSASSFFTLAFFCSFFSLSVCRFVANFPLSLARRRRFIFQNEWEIKINWQKRWSFARVAHSFSLSLSSHTQHTISMRKFNQIENIRVFFNDFFFALLRLVFSSVLSLTSMPSPLSLAHTQTLLFYFSRFELMP